MLDKTEANANKLKPETKRNQNKTDEEKKSEVRASKRRCIMEMST